MKSTLNLIPNQMPNLTVMLALKRIRASSRGQKLSQLVRTHFAK